MQAGEYDLAGIKALTEHPDFVWSNPNRMRSVVSVFAGANIPAFHAEDGSGYEYLSEVSRTRERTYTCARTRAHARTHTHAHMHADTLHTCA